MRNSGDPYFQDAVWLCKGNPKNSTPVLTVFTNDTKCVCRTALFVQVAGVCTT